MTQSFYPFSNSPILSQEQWSKVAQHWLSTGIIKGLLNELLVYADSTGMKVKVKSGQAYLKGHFYESDAEEVLAIGTANASNPRIDRVILRLDWAANTIVLAVLQGTAAASPVAPALTQNSSRWEIPLAQVRVDAAVTTIAAAKITDERVFANSNPYFYVKQGSGVGYATTNGLQQLAISSGITVLGGCTIGTNEITFPIGGKYVFEGDYGLSGLNTTAYAELLIRCYNADGVTYFDDSIQIMGYSGLGSNYVQSIPIFNRRIFDMPAGGKVQFFVRVTESPRTINYYKLFGYRIGD